MLQLTSAEKEKVRHGADCIVSNEVRKNMDIQMGVFGHQVGQNITEVQAGAKMYTLRKRGSAICSYIWPYTT